MQKRVVLFNDIILITTLVLSVLFILIPTQAQTEKTIQLSTETEDISLTDDLTIARAQVSKYPGNPEAHFNLAVALSRTSSVEEAIKELRKTKLLVRKPENKGIIDKKINEFKEILKNNPEANNVRYRLAFSHYLKAYLISKELEKKDKSKTNSKPNDKSPLKINLFGARRFISEDKNPEINENLNLSIRYFRELLELDPKDSWAKVYYAFILAEQLGEINKAKGLWLEVIKQEPQNPAPYFFIGELHIKEGDLKKGIQEIGQALLLRAQGF